MYTDGKLLIAKGEKPLYLLPKMANRHGLIAGATGTGKTTTLKVMAESFAAAGVPVFVADIKGDLAGTAKMGGGKEWVETSVQTLGLEGFNYTQIPTRFWDVFGKKGHPVRTTMTEIGPMLLARILGLNDTQEGILNITFRVADENGLLLLDIKDLRAMLQYVSENAKELSQFYGNITKQSVSAILRSLLSLEDAGGDQFFGEPAMDVKDWMQVSYDGKGFINILNCEQLFQSPVLYSTFMLWLLSELYESLPEVGDLEKPKMVFFFDEAHLLFDDAPKALLQKIEQVVRLIRSKAVGVYFITQNPTDIPDSVLGQLGNRVQHALRAYIPAELKKVKAAAETFRANPAFDTVDVITNLPTGQALVSFLDEGGAPSVVEKAQVVPPQTYTGTLTDEERMAFMANGGLGGKYDVAVDRESAYEILQQVAVEARAAVEEKLRLAEEAEEAEKQAKEAAKEAEKRAKAAAKEEAARLKAEEKAEAARIKAAQKEEAARIKAEEKAAKERQKKIEQLAASAAKSMTTSVVNSTLKRKTSKNASVAEKALTAAYNNAIGNVGRQATNTLMRGLLGTLLK
ncbi:MAG: DUF853 family protein [Oscillospiraceae bacterium]|nr:DUF853 family protein [Oscillospiraceae bacterium]